MIKKRNFILSYLCSVDLNEIDCDSHQIEAKLDFKLPTAPPDQIKGTIRDEFYKTKHELGPLLRLGSGIIHQLNI